MFISVTVKCLSKCNVVEHCRSVLHKCNVVEYCSMLQKHNVTGYGRQTCITIYYIHLQWTTFADKPDKPLCKPKDWSQVF